MQNKRSGFTLIEIMILVAIIGIITAIGIPNYLKSGRLSQKNSCVANLKMLASAVEMAKIGGVTVVTMDNLAGGPETFIKTVPACPTAKASYVALDPPACPTLPGEHHL